MNRSANLIYEPFARMGNHLSPRFTRLSR